MTLEPGLPSGWTLERLDTVSSKIQDGTHFSPKGGGHDFMYVTSRNIGPGRLRLENVDTISAAEHRKIYSRCDTRRGDLLITKDGANTGNAAINTFGKEVSLLSSVAFIRSNPRRSIEEYLLQYILSVPGKKQITDAMAGNAITRLTLAKIRALLIPLPPVAEQRRIATVLGRADDLIASLERLTTKKQAMKRGMMQELLTGKTRLPGFTGDWSTNDLGEIALILDNLRVPLSATQREGRSGPFPYCGANGVLDYIDDFRVDDDVILLAEDGGNFDQWDTRPIAYRMKGKIWVNNHAHIIKAPPTGDTGFLFYALEHKDITPFISSGTRSKLTRGELNRIRVMTPDSREEQHAVALALSDAEAEIMALQKRLTKAREMKIGMMQELLTGRTLLPISEAA